MARRDFRTGGMLFAGVVTGAFLTIFLAYFYVQTVTGSRIAESVARPIPLPSNAFRLEEIEGDSIAVVSVQAIEVRSKRGETVLSAPRATLRVSLPSLGGRGPTVIEELRLRRPYLNVIQGRDGKFNLTGEMVVSVGGQELDMAATGGAGGGGFELRDVRIDDGRVRLVTPYQPGPGEEPPAFVRRLGGGMRERYIENLDAVIPNARFGAGGWRVEVASSSGTLTAPEVRIRNLAGRAESDAQGLITFAVRQLRTGASLLTAAGTLRPRDGDLIVDVEGRASPLAFSDLRWLIPELPADGVATGDLAVEGGQGGRFTLSGTGVELAALDSRVGGYFSLAMGGGVPLAFGPTRLTLDPLLIETIQSFGIAPDLPYIGQFSGVVASAGGEAGVVPELDLDVVLTASPEAGGVPVSTIFLEGPLSFREGWVPHFGGVRTSFQPLQLAALRPLFDDAPGWLRGVARGGAVLTGTPDELDVAEGTLSLQVGNEAPSQIAELSGTLRLDPELAFDVSARAQPLALATVSALFPALPFRTARFTGPIRVAGTAGEIRVDAELSGTAGAIAVRGTVSPGSPMSFDLEGDVAAFSAEAVVTRTMPLEGPVTGSFSVEGSSDAFAFGVDLTQGGTAAVAGGSFALTGDYRVVTGAPPLFRVQGRLTDFNIGAAIGRPRLFPSRMTGAVDLQGGANQPYQFDVDLRGPAGVFDLSGFYAAGDVPRYSATGEVTGLDLRQLPGLQSLPTTALRGSLQVDARGTTPETLAGTLRFEGVGSVVAGARIDRMEVDMAFTDGVLDVRRVDAELTGTEITGQGQIGLSRPVFANPLRLRITSNDMGRLAPLAAGFSGLPPEMTGSFQLDAEMTGSVREPMIVAGFRGRRLRYEGFRAERLEVDVDLALADSFSRVRGRVEAAGEKLSMPGLAVDSLRLDVAGDQDAMTLELAFSREAGTEVQMAGSLEMAGGRPVGLLLDSARVRADAVAWRLDDRASIRWGGPEGVRIANFMMRSVNDPEASVRVDGNLPSEGANSLRVEARRLDLALLGRVGLRTEDLAGIVNLDVILSGEGDAPLLAVQGYGTGLRYQGVVLDSASLDARYAGQRMVAGANLWRRALRVASVDAEIPMQLTLSGGIPDVRLLRTTPIAAAIRADSLPLGLLTAGSELLTDGTGTIRGELNLTGTVEDPSLAGFAEIQQGALTATQLGRRFERISGSLILDEQQVLIDSLVVWSDGRAELNGSIRVTDLTRPELYLTATLDGFHAISNKQIADLTMSGDVQLQGVMPEPTLSGSVRLTEGTIYIPSLSDQAPLEITGVDLGQVGADTAVTAAVGPGIIERIRISGLEVAVDEGIWLESDEANVQIRGDLVLIRQGGPLQMFGTLEAVRGTYNLTIGPLVREFDVVSGSVRFLGTPDFNPDIDITAENQVRTGATAGGTGDLSVLVHVTGTLRDPSIELTSNTQPPLPESELLSYLIFGQPSFQLQGTGDFANQLVVQELVGGLLVQQLGDLGLPCDYFRLRGRPNIFLGNDALGATSVECGWELAEDLFLTVETGVLPNFQGTNSALLGTLLGMSLDWQINDRVTARVAREPVQSAFGLMILTPREIPYQFSAEVRGTWEFVRPRTRDLPISPFDARTVEQQPVVQPDTVPP